MSVQVMSIRRYPVKSMAGEALTTARLEARGVVGDRWFAVEDEQGHFASGKNTRRFRRRDGVFEYQAVSELGDVRVSGRGGSWTVGRPALDDALSVALGVPVRVRPEEAVVHQDAGAVSLVGRASLEWCAERWGVDADPRRLRTNIVLDTEEPFVEESWIGRTLELGSAVLTVTSGIERCRMIDIAQDGATARGQWLRELAKERAMRLGVYADVAVPGVVTPGDALRVV